jgi:hypothetical protein
MARQPSQVSRTPTPATPNAAARLFGPPSANSAESDSDRLRSVEHDVGLAVIGGGPSSTVNPADRGVGASEPELVLSSDDDRGYSRLDPTIRTRTSWVDARVALRHVQKVSSTVRCRKIV